jgi:hypothetical protein
MKNNSEKIKPKMNINEELNIFKTPCIKGLKLIYYKSKSFVFENNFFEDNADSFSKVTKHITNFPSLKKSLKKQEKELRIFKTYSIEMLKYLYYESIGIV